MTTVSNLSNQYGSLTAKSTVSQKRNRSAGDKRNDFRLDVVTQYYLPLESILAAAPEPSLVSWHQPCPLGRTDII